MVVEPPCRLSREESKSGQSHYPLPSPRLPPRQRSCASSFSRRTSSVKKAGGLSRIFGRHCLEGPCALVVCTVVLPMHTMSQGGCLWERVDKEQFITEFSPVPVGVCKDVVIFNPSPQIYVLRASPETKWPIGLAQSSSVEHLFDASLPSVERFRASRTCNGRWPRAQDTDTFFV